MFVGTNEGFCRKSLGFPEFFKSHFSHLALFRAFLFAQAFRLIRSCPPHLQDALKFPEQYNTNIRFLSIYCACNLFRSLAFGKIDFKLSQD